MDSPLASPGSTHRRDKTGVRTIKLRFAVEGPAEHEGAEPWDILDNWSPDAAPLGLIEIDRQSTKQEDGSWILEIVFEGCPDNAQLSDDYELDHSGAEDPVETFQGFDAVGKRWGAIFDGEKFDGFKRRVKDPVSGQSVKNPYFGVSHYLNDSVILRVTFNLTDYDPTWIRNICKIDEPRINNPRASALKRTPEGRNWLKRSVRVSFRGNVWQYTIEWYLSGPGGWLRDIYQPNN